MLKTIFLLLLGFCLVFILILSFKRPISATGNTKWGITFSHTFAKQSGFDWEEIYIAMLDDLKPQILRVPVYWPEVEKEEGKMNFEDYDFMIR
ncbi:hypothetical protein HY249_00165, partial [Candidatus Azambacteria bacterium]|nr:hypothetical protein [Candidatus Azambacteria bacterium]